MARFLSNFDLSGNQLLNAILQNSGAAPTVLGAGQVYFNTSNSTLYIYNGTEWVDLMGDIRSVTAGNGLVGGGTTGDITLNIGQGDGISVGADSISVSANPTYFGFSSGSLTINDGSIGADALAATGVTASTYGSATEIPVITVDADGRITSASTQNVSSTLNTAGDTGTGSVSLITGTLVFNGGTNITTSVDTDGSVTIDLDDSITLTGDLVVGGNLTVNGTVTTVNTETINLADNIITLNSNATGTPTENAGIEIERGDSDNVSLYWDEAADRWKLTYLVGPGTLTTSVIPVEGEYNNYVFFVNGDTGSHPVANGDVLAIVGGDGIDTAATTATGVDTVTITHADTSSVSDVDNSGLTVVQDLTFDGFGHVQSVGSSDLTSAVDGRITARQFKASIGNGTDTSYVINHNLNSRDLIIQLFDNDSYDTVFADVVRTDLNNVTVSFAAAPSLNDIRVLINKIG